MRKHPVSLQKPRAAAAELSSSVGQRWERALVLWKESKFSLGRNNLISGTSQPDTTYGGYVHTLAIFSPILRSLLVLQIGKPNQKPEGTGVWLCDPYRAASGAQGRAERGSGRTSRSTQHTGSGKAFSSGEELVVKAGRYGRGW